MTFKRLVATALLLSSHWSLGKGKEMPKKTKEITLSVSAIKSERAIEQIPSKDVNSLLFKLIGPLKKINYSINHPSGPNYPAHLTSQDKASLILVDLKRVPLGEHKLFLKKDKQSLATIDFKKAVAEYIDGDLIPKDPGAKGEVTLLGIDSDKDGVRDDVELWINSLGKNIEQRKALINYAKIYQQATAISESKEESILMMRKRTNYQYCILSKFNSNEDEAWDFMKKTTIKQFNNKERIYSLTQIEGHFGGSYVEVVGDRKTWSSFCEIL